METPQYDVFISYRRKETSELAQFVRLALEARGLRVFLDVTGLGAGEFAPKLLQTIESAPDFLLILAPGSLERCSEPGDWLASEISHALEANRNIVPLMIREFPLPAADTLPGRVSEIPKYQCVVYRPDYSGASIEKIYGMLRSAAARVEPRPRPRRAGWLATAVVVMTAVTIAAGWAIWRAIGPNTPAPADAAVELSGSFRKNRPAGARADTAPVVVYQPMTQPLPAASGPPDAVVGITVLRLRPVAAADDKEVRLLVHDDQTGESGEWTPVRASIDTPLAVGERIRLSIETARAGYLYVVDREQYGDSREGEPFLIFPTLRINSGNHAVTAGRVIEIPAWDDSPPYFRLRRGRPDQVGEILTIVVTSQPLQGLTVGRQPIRLPLEQVKVWEAKWGAGAERLEMVGGVGRPYTKVERAAGADQSRLLTQSEPLPQTIIRVASKAGEPLLVKVPLRMR